MSLRFRSALFVLSLSITTAGYAGAQTCPEQPDALRHWNPAGQQLACPCFAIGEEAGAVFTAPPEHYPIEILKVRIGWGASIGLPPAQLEGALRIYSGGLPNPGAPQFDLAGPVMTSGVINEFDLEFIPGNKTIASGPFSTSLLFANANANNIFAPSVIIAGGGCTPGANLIKFTNGTWVDACSQGVSGNWVFEVTYRIASSGCDLLNRDVTSISMSAGGKQKFTLAGGAAEAGKFYWIFGTTSGTVPGITLANGMNLPLNADSYTSFTVQHPFNPVFVEFFGSLDAQGNSFAELDVPPGTDPALVGFVLHHAYVTIPVPVTGDVDTPSNAQEVMLVI